MLGEFYALQGWDKQTGLQTRQDLAEIGLENLANKLAEAGNLFERLGNPTTNWE